MSFELSAKELKKGVLDSLSLGQLERIKQADIVIIGEIHPNPEHHVNQAELIGLIEPSAIVFEMVDAGKGSAFRKAHQNESAEALAKRIAEGEFGWESLARYLPLLDAAPDARIVGAAIGRSKTRRAVLDGAASVFGPAAERYGLKMALAPHEQETRESLQQEAHCNAMPEDLLPGIVEAQRLRDASFARSVVMAEGINGSPIVLITGNGHARTDWGVPAVLRRIVPNLKVVTIGQWESAVSPRTPFEINIETAPFDQDDPCEAFRK